MLFRVVIAAVASFTVMLVGFSFLMGVSKMDVSIKHEMQRHVVAEPIEAGDIVEISADGQRLVSVLCSLQLDENNRSSTEIKASYYNLVDYSQDRFVSFVERSKSIFGLPASTPAETDEAPFGLPFVGEVNRVVGSVDSKMSEDCICDVARAAIERRAKACVVQKSLVETEISEAADGSTVARRTVGISLSDTSIFFSNLEPIQALCPSLNISGSAPGAQSCGGQSGFSFDVVARAKIGLIREARLNAESSD